ncbi:MAG: peroxiredoxin family protein [Clostridia bacterium]
MKRLLLLAALLAATFAAHAASLKPWTGGRTPPLELADMDGAAHRLSDYRGKVVLVNFWATWCAPCRAEMPSIERLRAALEGRPFAVLAVNVGENPRAAREFAEKLPVKFTILMDRDLKATKSWSAKLLPASFVVGPDGAIKYAYLGDLDWSSPEVRASIEALMPREPVRAAR